VDLRSSRRKFPIANHSRKADAEGKHKKQSGGTASSAFAASKMEPIERGKRGVRGRRFSVAPFRGLDSSVEKGIRDAARAAISLGFRR